LPAHLGHQLGRGLILNTKEHAAGGVRQKLRALFPIGRIELRDILPNEHRRAVGAQERDRIHKRVKPTERAGFIKEQHHLVAGPLRAFLAHNGVERAARHHAQPAAIGAELFFVEAEVKRGDIRRVQVFQREGAGRRQEPRRGALRPGLGGFLQIRQYRGKLRLEALVIAHRAQEPLRHGLRERRGRVLRNLGDALRDDFLPADRELADVRQGALDRIRIMERVQDEGGQECRAFIRPMPLR